MYHNLSPFPLQSPLSSTISTDPARTSPPPIHHQLFAATNPPVMRSRVAHHHGLPDQPDRGGMRERRAKYEMTLSELQRSRGVEPAANPHTEVLEAYGYRQLAQWVMDMPAYVMNGVQAMNEAIGDAVSFRIGPPGAQAAPARRNPLSVDDFMKKFSADFEIRLSPAALNSADMRGMVIVIGEDHYDPSIQALVKKVMFEFSRTRGDRLFLEGGTEIVREVSMQKYQIQRDDCQLLEKNEMAFKALSVMLEEIDLCLRDCAIYLKKNVASSREDLRDKNSFDIHHFISKHEKNLPASKVAAYGDLQKKIIELKKRLVSTADKYRPQRDQRMADGVREERSETGLNYVIVGANHLTGVGERLLDLPVMMMVPRALGGWVPANKDEL